MQIKKNTNFLEINVKTKFLSLGNHPYFAFCNRIRDSNIPDQSFLNWNGMIWKYGSGNRNSGFHFQNIFRNCSISKTGNCSEIRSGNRKNSGTRSGNWKNSTSRSGNRKNSASRSGNPNNSGTCSGNRWNSGTNTLRKPNIPEHVLETGKFP